MRGRSDAQEYTNACEKLVNFIPQIQGGAFRRPSTNRIVLDTDSNADLQSAIDDDFVYTKLIPRVLSTDVRQVLATFDATPSTGWFVVDSTNPAAGGVVVGSVSSAADYTSPSSAAIKHAQIGDIVFLAQGSSGIGKPPRVWVKSAYTGGSMTLYDEHDPTKNYKAVPYLPFQTEGSSVNLQASAATGNITMTSSAAFFNAGHVGAYFKLTAAGSTGVVKVIYNAGNTNTLVYCTVLSTVPTVVIGTAAGTAWEESAWSDYRGWPRTVVAYQGRVIFGGSSSYPDTVWGSRIGNVFDMMEVPFVQSADFTGYAEDNSRPFTLTPNSAEASNIRALSSAKTLMIHTDRSEIVAYGTQMALGPNDATFESSTSFGASTPMPTRTNNFSVFVEKGGRKLRDITFNNDEGQYKSSDLSFLADHLTLDGVDITESPIDPIVEIVGVNFGTSLIFAKTQHGRLLAVTLDRDYKINAWSQIKLGGSSAARDFPLIKAMCAVERSDGGERLFLITNRYINGVRKAFQVYPRCSKQRL
jgi:hypothetical protein